jgi:hypothetical protein
MGSGQNCVLVRIEGQKPLPTFKGSCAISKKMGLCGKNEEGKK